MTKYFILLTCLLKNTEITVGNLGTFSQGLFIKNNGGSGSWVYLTYIAGIKDFYNSRYETSTKIICNDLLYEVRYKLVENNKHFLYSAIYIGDTVTPERLMTKNTDCVLTKSNTGRWKYHKIIINMDNKAQVVHLHERCLEYFTWHNTQNINLQSKE